MSDRPSPTQLRSVQSEQTVMGAVHMDLDAVCLSTGFAFVILGTYRGGSRTSMHHKGRAFWRTGGSLKSLSSTGTTTLAGQA
jgi:hypothetical protein